MITEIKRRKLLFFGAGLALSACSNNREIPFRIVSTIKQGTESLEFPLGKDRPETGVYTINLDPIPADVKPPRSYAKVFNNGKLRLTLVIRELSPEIISVSSQIGKSTDEKARDFIKDEPFRVSIFAPRHQIQLEWNNWQFTSVNYNGNILLVKPKQSK